MPQYQRRYIWWTPSLFVLVIVFFALRVASIQGQGASAGQPPVPRWIAWRVFHQSLVFYGQRSPAQVRQILEKEIGLTDLQAAKLLSAGQTVIADLDTVDRDGKAEIARRYKYVPVQSGPPTDGVKRRPARPQKGFLERANEDGFYAEIQAQKEAVLANHIKALGFDGRRHYSASKHTCNPRLHRILRSSIHKYGRPIPLSDSRAIPLSYLLCLLKMSSATVSALMNERH